MEIPSDAAELAHRIVEIASDKKGNDIVLLRTAELTTMADFFVIASGRSDRQVQALAGAIVDELRKEGIRPLGHRGARVVAAGCCSTTGASSSMSSRPRSASTTASSGCGARPPRSCASSERYDLASWRASSDEDEHEDRRDREADDEDFHLKNPFHAAHPRCGG